MIRIVLNAVKPNYAIGSTYRIQLSKLIRAMTSEISDAVKDEYTDQIHDSVDSINATINFIVGKWQANFNAISHRWSSQFIKAVADNTSYQLRKSIGKQNVAKPLVVGLSRQNVEALNSVQAAIKANVNLIQSIPEKYHGQITNLVNQSMSLGKSKSFLVEELQKIDGTTKLRAQLIARDQLRKATSAIDNERRLKLGITKAIWIHSAGDKEPRKSHLAASGREYDIKQGCYIDGEYIQVGEKINCTCYSKSVIEFD